MDNKILAIFCLCDDLLTAMHHHEDRQCQMEQYGNHDHCLHCCFILSRESGKRSYSAQTRWLYPSHGE